MKHLMVTLASLIFLGLASAASACTGSGCDEQQYQTGRDTSAGEIVEFANHCDATLRRVGEALSFQVTPAGHTAYSSAARKLNGLSWASTSKAADRFGEYDILASDGRVVVETELCASSEVWERALASVGVTVDQILSGEVIVWLCGDEYAHRLPARRFSFLLGQESRGQYSVLSRADTRLAEDVLTRLGF